VISKLYKGIEIPAAFAEFAFFYDELLALRADKRFDGPA
jgi:hypothetical protein